MSSVVNCSINDVWCCEVFNNRTVSGVAMCSIHYLKLNLMGYKSEN